MRSSRGLRGTMMTGCNSSTIYSRVVEVFVPAVFGACRRLVLSVSKPVGRSNTGSLRAPFSHVGLRRLWAGVGFCL